MAEPAFELLGISDRARRGRLNVAHGIINTPAFMPVGTAATVKAMLPESVRATGAEIILANTYHLMLRPGSDRVADFGGLHQFMNWPGPILTDSGGFQVMSLSDLRKLHEDGVEFRSHIDGSKHLLTPERSVEIQHQLDSDITMAFDECAPYPSPIDDVVKSMRLTTRWARRSKQAFVERPGYRLFGIVQGGVHDDLRRESAAQLIEIGFDGYAIGGLAVGEEQDVMFGVLDTMHDLLPPDRPRYLMGVGRPQDIIGAVLRGVDMFDCVLPTRGGRTGLVFTRWGEINMRNARHAGEKSPIDPACSCPACRSYSRGYLHHLLKAKEILAAMLLTWHNLHYYQELMGNLRAAIEANEISGRAVALLKDLEGSGDPPS